MKKKAKTKPAAKRKSKRKWSGNVTEHSHAMDLEPEVLKGDNPKKIAGSLKRSAQESHTRKSEPYRSAMAMLTFYVNRAGKNLSAARKTMLERAKAELRRLFHKE